ncbi:flippase [Planktomarina temperata]|nr:flippase [Planktomarina temperata]
MIIENFVRLSVMFTLTICVAQFLTPNEFGLYSLICVTIGLMVGLSRAGQHSVMVPELLSTSTAKFKVITASFIVITVVGFFVALPALLALQILFNYVLPNGLIFLLAAISVIQGFIVVDFYFQGMNQAKFSAISKILVLLSSLTLNIACLKFGFGINYLVILIFLEHVVLAIVLCVSFRLFGPSDFNFQLDPKVISKLAGRGLKIGFGAVLISLYTKIDQFMIGSFLNLEEVGIYALASNLQSGWLSFLYVLSIAFAPDFVKARKVSRQLFNERLIDVTRLFLLINLFVILVILILPEQFLRVAFHSKYDRSLDVLKILALSGLFTSLGCISARYASIERVEHTILVRSLIGLILNIILNLMFIPTFGIQGAAIATLITSFVVNVVFSYLNSELRPMAKTITASFKL